MKRCDSKKAYLVGLVMMTAFISILSGCGGGGNGSWTQPAAAGGVVPVVVPPVVPVNAPPTVTNISPANGATGVPITTKFITARFSKAMNQSTINLVTYTVQALGPPLVPKVAGTITYNAVTNTATFSPTADLTPDTLYTVTVSNAATDTSGNALVVPAVGLPANPWTFRTAPAAPGPVIVIDLKSASSYGISATAGVTNTITAPISHINGNVVLDPNQTCNAVAVDNAGGFGLCNGMAPTINGTVVTNIYPDTTTAATVRADLNAAFISITPPAGPPAAGALGGATAIPAGTTLGALTGSALVQGDNYFIPGVYQSLTEIIITDDITLDGQLDPNAIFIFQTSSTLKTADGSVAIHPRILLINGAKASNVWWQVATSATIGTNSEFYGNILAALDITMKTGATACGRSMAGAWVGGAGKFVFDSNVVSVPGHPNAPPACQ